MKKLILLFCLFISVVAMSQSKDDVALMASARALHIAVFANKDSAALDRLFGNGLSYGHSSGKIETRAEAITAIAANKSKYNDLNMGPVSVWIEGRTGITRHTMTATEVTVDGKSNPLKLHIVLVWVKDKKLWRLLARQAVRVT